MIGDRWRDIEAGQSCRVPYHSDRQRLRRGASATPDAVVATLSAAADLDSRAIETADDTMSTLEQFKVKS